MNDFNNLALFCDFENIALGVRDANYAKFDIRLVLERLLLKGSIVAKKAYCVVQTGERRFFGCFIFKKGVIPPDAG